MTAPEFRENHGDPITWTTADVETQQNLAACDAHHPVTPDTVIPGTTKAAADRLRALLAPAA
ncbi:hypothetical protein PV677_35910 [Streptomyces sp. DE06-01C]|uniref:hypothetical protein n=1 Tax=Streptomyces sp. DE06-01C TaxID=3028656 RepID=UPI0029C10859|nr:hypothetical protein [Streptomyces sp. DE06-01C]MDX5526056.1 hypothetical protein [Streptomyces sp. DE06-01C]